MFVKRDPAENESDQGSVYLAVSNKTVIWIDFSKKLFG